MRCYKIINLKVKGFSLVELLIVMVVISILISLAYPSYRAYINRANRADGQASLLDLASRMERYYSDNHTYETASIGTGNTTDVISSANTPEGWYTLAISNANADSYTIIATPTGTQATYDTLCQTLTYNNLGNRGIATGPGGTPTGSVEECW